MAMLTFDEALEQVLQGARRAAVAIRTEHVPLHAAFGRVLAESVRAEFPLPPHDYSAMDGYALDVTGVQGESPWVLPVVGESRTGRVPPVLEPGTLCRIFTGAAVPAGTTAVVMQENVDREENRGSVRVLPAPGENIRRAGEDVREGTVVIEAGTRLGAYHLGLLAAVDRSTVEVARRPRVTIVSTGDELRAPGSPRRPASIPESNGVVIAALATSAGATVSVGEPSGDDLTETRDRLHAALGASDLLVTIGGVSVGDHDVVRPALEAAGVTLDFYKVAMKPGKPLTLGRRGDTLVLGLPGNPVSAQVTFSLFGLPLLRALQGDTRGRPTPRRLRVRAPIRQKPGRLGFYAASVAGDTVTPLAHASSGSTASLAWADALVVLPLDSSGCAEGDLVDVLVLAEL